MTHKFNCDDKAPSWRGGAFPKGVDMEDNLYRFPSNKRAEAETIGAQLRKLSEETAEANAAFNDGESPARIIEETWDVIQAAEGVLRKFGPLAVMKGFAMVVLKGCARGDYRNGKA